MEGLGRPPVVPCVCAARRPLHQVGGGARTFLFHPIYRNQPDNRLGRFAVLNRSPFPDEFQHYILPIDRKQSEPIHSFRNSPGLVLFSSFLASLLLFTHFFVLFINHINFLLDVPSTPEISQIRGCTLGYTTPALNLARGTPCIGILRWVEPFLLSSNFVVVLVYARRALSIGKVWFVQR